MAAIRFYLKALKNGECQILAALQAGSKTPPTKYLGYNIPGNKVNNDYKYWDKKKCRVRGLNNADEVNKKIVDWITIFDNYISECNLNELAPDMHYIKSQLKGIYLSEYKHSRIKGKPLLEVTQAYIDSQDGFVSPKTKGHYEVLQSQLQKFQEKKGCIYYITDVDQNFYKEFVSYLILTHKNTNNTIQRKQGKLATMIASGAKTLKIKNISMEVKDIFAVKTIKAARFPLRPDEILHLQNKFEEVSLLQLQILLAEAHSELDKLRINKAGPTFIDKAVGKIHQAEKRIYYRQVLAAFLLSNETSLRLSDVLQLKPQHIVTHVSDNDLIHIIDLTAFKSDTANNMPISKYAGKILDEYAPEDNTPYFQFSSKFLHALSKSLKLVFKNYDMNRICEVVRKQGSKTSRESKPLHEVISFHMARNTYITRMLAMGVAPVHVQHNAGHKKLETTMAYFRDEEIERWQKTLEIQNK